MAAVNTAFRSVEELTREELNELKQNFVGGGPTRLTEQCRAEGRQPQLIAVFLLPNQFP